MPILSLLDSSPIVQGYVVHDYRHWETGSYFKIAVWLKNDTLLFVREYASESQRMYSFHWQDKANTLIARWDNAPHHQHLSTFPHHCHIHGQVTDSRCVSLEDVLSQITREIRQRDSSGNDMSS